MIINIQFKDLIVSFEEYKNVISKALIGNNITEYRNLIFILLINLIKEYINKIM